MDGPFFDCCRLTSNLPDFFSSWATGKSSAVAGTDFEQGRICLCKFLESWCGSFAGVLFIVITYNSSAEKKYPFIRADWLNRTFKYEQDHLHPYDRFDGSKPLTVSMDDWRRWRGNRNRLPNLQLLEGRSNGSKNAMLLVDNYNDMNDE